MSQVHGYPPLPKRVCIFVDGENFRYSLAALFPGNRYTFSKHDYLPDSDWSSFFGSLIKRPGWELVRVYWYVTREIDVWPSKVPFEWVAKEEFLTKHNVINRLRSQGIDGAGLEQAGLLAAERQLLTRSKAVQERANGWKAIQTAIEHKNDQIEFRRVGSIRFDTLEKKFAKEKGVDTQMATDMIVLADIYDVALVVSGDADYIPPVSAIKKLGKLAYSVSFLTETGTKLPGGAVRLERRVDGRIELTFKHVMEKLGVSKKPRSRPAIQRH